MTTKHTLASALLVLFGGSAQGQLPFATLHYQADPSTYSLNGLHLELRADGRPLLLASGDTIHLNGLDTTGTIQWTSALAQPPGYALQLTDLLPLDDGTLAACGFIYQPAPELGLYLHLDTLGNVLSARTYSLNFNTRFFALAANANGSVRITGYQQPSFPADYYGVVVDVNTSGDLLGASTFTIGQVATLPTDLIPTADGGHVIIGESWTLNNGLVLFKTAHIAKLDSTGQIEWARRLFAANQHTFPQGVVQLAHGDLVYVVRAQFPQGSKAVMVTLDLNGNEIHVTQVDPDTPSDGYLDSYGLTLQGESMLVLSGFTNIISDMFTLRIDTALTTPQLLLHDRTPGEWIEDQVVLADGNILQASYAASPLTGNCILMRGLAPDGTSNCPNRPCTVTQSTPNLFNNPILVQNLASPIVADATALFPSASITLLNMPACLGTGTAAITPVTTVGLMPNPASREVCITAEDLRQVQVLDAMGRLLADRHLHASDTCVLDLEGLLSGLLVVRVRTGSGWSAHRLVKD